MYLMRELGLPEATARYQMQRALEDEDGIVKNSNSSFIVIHRHFDETQILPNSLFFRLFDILFISVKRWGGIHKWQVINRKAWMISSWKLCRISFTMHIGRLLSDGAGMMNMSIGKSNTEGADINGL